FPPFIEACKSNILKLEMDFIPIKHVNHFFNACSKICPKELFEIIRISWNSSNNAQRYFTGFAFSNSDISKNTLFLKHLRIMQKRKTSTTKYPILCPEFDVAKSISFIRNLTCCFGDNLTNLELVGLKLSTHCIKLIAQSLKSSHN